MSRFHRPQDSRSDRDDLLPSERAGRRVRATDEDATGRWTTGEPQAGPTPVRGRGCLLGLAVLAFPLMVAFGYAVQTGSWDGTDPYVVHMEQGRTLSHAQKLDEALAEFEAAKAARPDSAQARDSIAMIYLEQGKLEEGVAMAKEGIALDPSDSHIHVTLGLLYSQKDLVDLEIEEYKTAIRLWPENAIAHYDLGLTYGRKGMTELAIRELEASIRYAEPNAHHLKDAREALDDVRRR